MSLMNESGFGSSLMPSPSVVSADEENSHCRTEQQAE
jgi:hypothetical protein